MSRKREREAAMRFFRDPRREGPVPYWLSLAVADLMHAGVLCHDSDGGIVESTRNPIPDSALTSNPSTGDSQEENG